MRDDALLRLDYWAQQRPDAIALSLNHGDLTWQQLQADVQHMSLSLAEQGVSRGDVVSAIGKNSPKLLQLYLACLNLGAICAILSPQTSQQLLQKLAILSCRLVWLGEGAEQDCVPSHCQLIELPTTGKQSKPSRQTVPLSAAGIKPIRPSHPLNLASIVFTSGSSGEPKAVAHTAAQHLASASGLLETLRFDANDSWLLSLPMYHISGLAIVWRWLSVGARLKMASGDLLADLAHVSHASLVATQLLRVMEPLLAARSKSAEQQASAVSLRCVLLGGSHIPVQLAQQVDALGIETWVGYGMTEAASTVSAKRISSTAAQTSNSVGRVLPKRSLALQGERILIAGDTLASGYYHQGALKPLMVAEPVTQCSTKRIEGAWFDTNDLGRWQGGELTILGRADNRFISGGENIYCEEIEAVLQRHDTVSQVIVVPVKSAEFGARPVAVIASSSGLQVASYQALLATCLEKYKWPIDYFLLADTDSVSNGVKISRAKVKDWLVSVQDKYRIYSP